MLTHWASEFRREALNGNYRNGSAGLGRDAGSTSTAGRDEKVSFGRIYSLLRAHLDTLAETDRRTGAVEGLDRAQALRDFADEVEADVPVLLQVAGLARAEAISLDRSRVAPLPKESSETRRARAAAEGREDSSPGRKRS